MQMLLCGVDEAGKGPVFGPMVTGGILVEDVSSLENLGIKDSKQLTVKKREEIFAHLTSSYKYYTVVKSPQEIDARPSTMNAFTVSCHAEVVRALRPDKVFLDACDVNAKRFGVNVISASGVSAEVVSEHKADDKYLIVGAASIIAKVTRDRLVEELKVEFGDIGSGYPSDPQTIRFLEEYIRMHGEAPSCARKSWKTVSEALSRCRQKNLTDFF
ncbi:MAG TPA: ribonuclease HII [Methanocorpusculum sp.]|nr:ribonuclease HII [Methanocorpusculum sp.]